MGSNDQVIFFLLRGPKDAISSLALFSTLKRQFSPELIRSFNSLNIFVFEDSFREEICSTYFQTVKYENGAVLILKLLSVSNRK